MTFSLTWLPEVLESAGLKVAVDQGWETRGRAEMGQVLGVICHHTAGPRKGNMPSLATLRDGRPDLPGPLSQLGLGRDGTFYVVAAGRCNHAGAGSWQGLVKTEIPTSLASRPRTPVCPTTNLGPRSSLKPTATASPRS